VGWQEQTYLVEIKNPKGTLTPDQEQFITLWRGSKVHVIRTVDDLIDVLAQPKISKSV